MIEIRHPVDPQRRYDDIYAGETIHQMDSFFLMVKELLDLRPGQKLIDIATGRGQMVAFAGAGVKAYGLDFSATACQRAGVRTPGVIFQADALHLPLPANSFDAATNLGSLEHFEDMQFAVREMARVLKPTGLALLTVPNTFGLRWNVQYAWRTGDVDDDGQPLQRYGTRRQWETILQENGLAIERVLGYEHERAFPRTKRDMLNYLRHPRRLFSMLFITPFIPVNMAGQFVFICRPA